MRASSLAALRNKYDAVNIKLDKTGGLTEALATAEEADAARACRDGRLHGGDLAGDGAGDAGGAARPRRRPRRRAPARARPHRPAALRGQPRAPAVAGAVGMNLAATRGLPPDGTVWRPPNRRGKRDDFETTGLVCRVGGRRLRPPHAGAGAELSGQAGADHRAVRARRRRRHRAPDRRSAHGDARPAVHRREPPGRRRRGRRQDGDERGARRLHA